MFKLQKKKKGKKLIKKLFLLIFIVLLEMSFGYSNQLQFVLDNIRKNINEELPIQLNDGGIINNVKVKKDTLILFLKYPYIIQVNKKDICNNFLIRSIIQEGGTVEYIVNMKNKKVDYVINRKTCSSVN